MFKKYQFAMINIHATRRCERWKITFFAWICAKNAKFVQQSIMQMWFFSEHKKIIKLNCLPNPYVDGPKLCPVELGQPHAWDFKDINIFCEKSCVCQKSQCSAQLNFNNSANWSPNLLQFCRTNLRCTLVNLAKN